MQTDLTKKKDLSCTALPFLLVALLGAFALPLALLFPYALSRDLYSHIVLIPFISGYLIWQERERILAAPITTSRVSASILAGAGLLAMVLHTFLLRDGYDISLNDALSLAMFALVSGIIALVLICRGWQAFRIAMFPILFLYFIVPFPELVESGLERFFQVTSAYCYAGLLTLTRTPFIQDGMVFQLPGLTVQVATECSGIRSSLVLCITGLLGAHMFLKAPWRKAIVSLLFIPIGILRNAVRILTVTLGSIYIDPSIMEGPVHRRGGPPFFVLSLIPLMLILWLMRRREMKVMQSHEANQQ